MAEETKKQMYIGIKVLEDAQPMTLAQAKEAGLVKADYEGEEDGYKVTYADGYASWSPKTIFDETYAKLSDADAKFIAKLDDSPVKTIKLALKLRGFVRDRKETMEFETPWFRSTESVRGEPRRN